MRSQQLIKLLLLLFLSVVNSRKVPDPAEKDAPGHRHQVIIIGAGASGLAAASKLVELGVEDVLVIEARDRVGGRVYTQRIEDVGDRLEIGAQFIHGEKGNAAFQIASAMNLTNRPNSPDERDRIVDLYSFPNGTIPEAGDIAVYENMLYEAIEKLEEEYEPESLTESMGSYYDAELARLSAGQSPDFVETINLFKDGWHRAQLIEEAAENWYDVNLQDLVDYITWEGDPEVVYKKGHGYTDLLDFFLDWLDGKIMLNSPVAKIVYPDDNDFVKVQLKNGHTLEAEYVLVTVSLGVLKHQVKELFEPELPKRKLDAIDFQGFGVIDKIYAWYEEPWWQPVTGSFVFLGSQPMNYTEEDAKNDWTDSIAFLYKIADRDNLLSFWLAGSGAKVMESLSEEQMAADISKFMDKRFGDKFPLRTEPTKLLRTRWHSDPLTRGSYSFGSQKSLQTGLSWADLAEPVGRVHFAGEATNAHRHSSVDGAIEAGWREAELITDRIADADLSANAQ